MTLVLERPSVVSKELEQLEFQFPHFHHSTGVDTARTKPLEGFAGIRAHRTESVQQRRAEVKQFLLHPLDCPIGELKNFTELPVEFAEVLQRVSSRGQSLVVYDLWVGLFATESVEQANELQRSWSKTNKISEKLWVRPLVPNGTSRQPDPIKAFSEDLLRYVHMLDRNYWRRSAPIKEDRRLLAAVQKLTKDYDPIMIVIIIAM